MFNGIRSRLIISYVVVIFVALVIALLALFLLSRPIQTRLVQFRLSTELSQVIGPLEQLLRQERPGRRGAVEPFAEQLRQHLPPLQHRLLILDSHGRVLFDSQDKWIGDSITLSSPVVSTRIRTRFTNGHFVGPDTALWLYVAKPYPAVSDSPPKIYVALVTPYPKTTAALISDLWIGFWVAGLIAFMVSILLGWAIARSVARPLRRIALAAEAVADGNYSHKIPETGPAEVKQVASAFNSMVQQVQASQTAMRDFVSNVSHDLKTPLTSIQGFSQALLDGTASDDETRIRAATIIHNEATRMRRLVEDLLDLARIDAGQIVMDKNPINLKALLSITLDSLAPQIAAKNIILSKDFDTVPVVVGDGDRLKQVFTNLLDNAIKHTPPGGKIRIDGHLALAPENASTIVRRADMVASAQRFARIAIADTGPGIPPEELSRIFERFYQVDKSRKQGPGIGLGLAIVYNIVKGHGGHIQAQSKVGHGTQFTVWLPCYVHKK